VTTRAKLFRAALVLLAALVLQVTMLSDLRILGALGDLMLALTVAAGLTGGADRGVTWGFATGVCYDLVLLDTPFGLSALTYALVGYAASALMRTSGWWPVGVAAVAGAVQATLYTALANLLGDSFPFGHLPAIGLVMAAWCALLVLPLIRVMWWVHGHSEPDRLEVLLR
jgi:rod shape-determining protein MreD